MSRLRPLTLVLAIGTSPVAAVPSAGDPMTDILDRMRSALHIGAYLEPDRDWLLSGRHEENGVAGETSLRFESRGRFRRTVDSTLGRSEAFDGERGWQTDIRNMPGALELSSLTHAQLDAWITTGVWLATPGLIEPLSVAGAPEPGLVEIRLRVAGSPLSGTLVVDRDTALPLRFETPGLSGPIVRTFERYAESAGVRFPESVVRTVAGQVESRTTWRTLTEAPGDADFTSRPLPPDDAHFSAAPGTVPLRIAPTGHLLVTPSVNGEPMPAFIFDTGAGQSGLQSNPPDSLGFRVVGEGVVSSIFGVTSSPILAAERLRLGPLTIDDPVFMTMDFTPFEAVFGEPIGGIIGYDVFRRAVVEVDLDEARLTIHDPTTYTLTEGTWRALRFQDNHPIVSAAVEGIEGLFRLDLGAAGGPHGNLVLNSPAVEQHGFLDGRETVEGQLGVQPVAVGRIASFDFAGVRFDDLEVAFGLTGEGLFHDVYTMGNIGVNVLRRFRILFDYGRARIALIPKLKP